MADQSRPMPPPLFSTMAPGDLGLKVGYWSGKEGDPVAFRPIVGWLTVMNVADRGVGDEFMPVVINDADFPVVQLFGAFGCIGVFREAVTPDEALARYQARAPRQPGAGGFVS